MKAAIVRRYGPPGEIELGDVPAPIPGPGQVRVRVRAASLNPLDIKLRSGSLRPFLTLKFPAVLGLDFAGEIESLGAGVTGWTTGERVYGRTDPGSGGTHAELAVVRAGVMDRMPKGLSFEQAASLPLVAMTALQALRGAELKAGQRLLVNGAAGGVGTAAVQVGRAMDALVAGVCSGESAPLVTRLRAKVFDYTKGDLARATERFDVILDTVFGLPPPDLIGLLAERGCYTSTGFSLGLIWRSTFSRLWSRQRFRMVSSRADGGLMRSVSELVAAGKLQAVIDSTFPLERIAEAHRRVEGGHAHGKVVVTIG